MEELLEQAAKVCEQAEVFSVSRQETNATFEANRLKTVQTRQSKSVALRIIKQGRIGFSVTNKIDSGRELLAMALETAPFGAQAKFELPPFKTYPNIEVYDTRVETVSVEEMVELGYSLIAKVRDFSPDIICDAGATKSLICVDILNSRGGQASYKKSTFSLGLEGILTRGTDMLFVGESESSCHPISDWGSVADATIEQLDRAKNSAPPPRGRLPVVFTPRGVASTLIMPLAIAFNGKTVLQGASPLGNRKGEQAFDHRFCLWDDATIDYRPGSRFCDDEGVPSQRTTLIENGVVTNFLYDLQTASLAGSQSTGSAHRPPGNLPTPSASALVIEEGQSTFEEMIADMKQGLVIDRLMGAGQGNILGGEFSGNVLLGYKVENGAIVGRVKNTMVSGNVYEILKEILAIGSEAKWVGGLLKTPPLYCRSLAVATKR